MVNNGPKDNCETLDIFIYHTISISRKIIRRKNGLPKTHFCYSIKRNVIVKYCLINRKLKNVKTY